jgi:amino acid transporter
MSSVEDPTFSTHTVGGEGTGGLERSLGLQRVLFQSIAVMGPGASIVFGLGLIVSYTGAASPLAMVIALIAALCVATAIGQLATRIAGAGGLYSYAATALSPSVGFLVGWLYVGMTFVLPAVGAVLFGIVGQDFCSSYLGFDPPWWVLSLIAAILPVASSYVGVRLATSVSLVLGVVEIAIIAVVGILLVIRAGGDNTLTVFDPSQAAQPHQSTTHLMFLGVVYAAATFVGFESSVQLAEEAKDPRRTVPRAVVLATGAIGLFYVFAMYVAVVSWGPDKLGTYVSSDNAWRVMADHLGSAFAFLIVLAILNSTLALTQAGYTATTRLLYGMASSGVLPRFLARLHPVHRTPYVAALLAGALSIITMLVVSALVGGPFPAFVYMITMVSITFLVFYIVTVIACIVYFTVRRPDLLRPMLHIVVPLIGGAVLAVALYYSLRGLTYPATWSGPTVLVWFAIGLIIAVALKRGRRDIGREARRWLETDAATDTTKEAFDGAAARVG